MLTAELSLCPQEIKPIVVMWSTVTLVNTNPAGQVHTIRLVTSGREDASPYRVNSITFVIEIVCSKEWLPGRKSIVVFGVIFWK